MEISDFPYHSRPALFARTIVCGNFIYRLTLIDRRSVEAQRRAKVVRAGLERDSERDSVPMGENVEKSRTVSYSEGKLREDRIRVRGGTGAAMGWVVTPAPRQARYTFELFSPVGSSAPDRVDLVRSSARSPPFAIPRVDRLANSHSLSTFKLSTVVAINLTCKKFSYREIFFKSNFN